MSFSFFFSFFFFFIREIVPNRVTRLVHRPLRTRNLPCIAIVRYNFQRAVDYSLFFSILFVSFSVTVTVYRICKVDQTVEGMMYSIRNNPKRSSKRDYSTGGRGDVLLISGTSVCY